MDTTAEELATGLEALAERVRSNPILAEHFNSAVILCWADNKAALAALTAAAGPSTKNGSGDLIGVDRKFGPVELSVRAYKADTCERVQVGERTVTREVYPDGVVPAVVTEEVPVFEYRCPESFLALTERVPA